MRDDVVKADIEQIRSALLRLAERYAAGERSVLQSSARDLRDQVICLLDEAPSHFAELGYLADRCQALIVAVLD